LPAFGGLELILREANLELAIVRGIEAENVKWFSGRIREREDALGLLWFYANESEWMWR